MTDAPGTDDAVSPRCSARACRSPAVWVLSWNNPTLHTPDRRKSWTACGDHLEHLRTFLDRRGFLREVHPVAGDGAASRP